MHGHEAVEAVDDARGARDCTTVREVTAVSASGPLPAPPPPASPREIRLALLPEDVGQFDSEWRSAMKRSAESLDLSEVYRVLERWRGIAILTQADPEAHRRMLARAKRVLEGQDRGTVTADQMREMIARRLG
jgi:hypothetical protein